MAVNIEQMRSDMLRRQSDFEISQKWETRKFAVQLIAALGTAFAGGVAVTTLVLHLIGKL